MNSSPKSEKVVSSLGEKLRAHRRERGWTLEQAATATGLAISTLSKVERGLMSPTFDKIQRLSIGLNLDISELFGHPPATSIEQGQGESFVICRNGDGYPLETRNYDYVYLCTKKTGKSAIPSVAQIKCRDIEKFGPFLRHEGEEFVYVLSGAVLVYIEGMAPVQLDVGESIYFDASQGHAFLSAGEGAAKVLVVISGDEGREKQLNE